MVLDKCTDFYMFLSLYIHMSGQKVKHQVLLRIAHIVPCRCDNFVAVVVPALSSDTHISGSPGHSAENTAEIAPSDRDATQASRSRLTDLPEWL